MRQVQKENQIICAECFSVAASTACRWNIADSTVDISFL